MKYVVKKSIHDKFFFFFFLPFSFSSTDPSLTVYFLLVISQYTAMLEIPNKDFSPEAQNPMNNQYGDRTYLPVV